MKVYVDCEAFKIIEFKRKEANYSLLLKITCRAHRHGYLGRRTNVLSKLLKLFLVILGIIMARLIAIHFSKALYDILPNRHIKNNKADKLSWPSHFYQNPICSLMYIFVLSPPSIDESRSRQKHAVSFLHWPEYSKNESRIYTFRSSFPLRPIYRAIPI